MRKFAASGMLIALLHIGVTASAAEVPVRTFAQDPKFKSMTISPSGKYLAGVVALGQGEGEGVLVMDRKARKVTANFRTLPKEIVNQYFWASDERVVMTFAKHVGFDEGLRTSGDIYAFNADGSKFGRIYRGKAENVQILDSLPEDDAHILVALHPYSLSAEGAVPKVVSIDVYGKSVWGGKKVASSPLHTASFLPDAQGRVRYLNGISLKGESQVYYREDGEGKWKLIRSEPRERGVPTAIAFSRDGASVFQVVPAEQGPDVLQRMDVATGKVDTLLRHAAVSPHRLLFSADGKDVIGAEFLSGKPEYQYLSVDHPDAKFHQGLVKAFGGQFVEITSHTKDGSEAMVYVHGDRNPGEYYLVNRHTKRAEFIMASNPDVDPEQLAEMKPFSFKARDGLELHGYLTLPNHVEPKNLPMVVYPHGGPEARDVWGYDPYVQVLANRGYAVLQVNFRHSSGYGRAFTQAGYRQWGRRMQDDITDATRWAIEQGYADKSRICLFGASYGGYATMMGLIREPDLYRCGINYVGVTDLTLGDERQMVVHRLEKHYWQSTLGTDYEELKANSPLYNVAKLQSSVLIVHGGEDWVVPIRHAELLKDAMEKEGKAFEWYVEEKEVHGFFNPENRAKLFDRILGFLGKHIGPGAQPTQVAGQ